MLALRAAVRAAAAAPGGAAAAVRPSGLVVARAAFPPSALRWQSVEAAPAATGGADVSSKVGQLVNEIVDLNMLEVKQLTDALKVRPVERAARSAAGWEWALVGVALMAHGGGTRWWRRRAGVRRRWGRGGSGGGACSVRFGLLAALASGADVLLGHS